jgi:hypothetical protein
MPNPMTESAVQSIELEEVDGKIAELIPLFEDDLAFFEKRAKKVNIANETAAGAATGRPAWRNTMVIQGGAPIVTGTGDQTSLLRGTGILTAAFAQAPVGFFGVTEYTYLSEIATAGKERGLVEISTDLVKRSLASFRTGISAQIAGPGVGSGTIAIIPTTATVSSGSGTGATTSYISGITNAASFTDQQVVTFWSSEGGTQRGGSTGSATVSYNDAVAQTVWFSTNLPSGTTNGDYVVISGSSSAQGSGLANIHYWNINSNTGTVGGLSRANYPGRLSTPTINKLGQQITPSDFQRALILLGRALGSDAEAMESMVWYGQPDQVWTLNAQFYERMITQNLEKGSDAMDIGRKMMSKTFGMREYQVSYQADPSRVDGLVMSNWVIGMLKEIGLYDFGGGNTVMPVPDVGTTNGTYITDRMFVYDAFLQLCNKAPRSGLYFSNCGYLQA